RTDTSISRLIISSPCKTPVVRWARARQGSFGDTPSPRRTRTVSETLVRGQTTSYAEWRAALGGGSNEKAIRIGRPRSIAGTEPATVEMNGTVGGPLIDAVARAHGSSHIRAHPSKAMPMGPATAHIINATTTNPLRQDIGSMVSRTRNQAPRSRFRASNSCLSISPRAYRWRRISKASSRTCGRPWPMSQRRPKMNAAITTAQNTEHHQHHQEAARAPHEHHWVGAPVPFPRAVLGEGGDGRQNQQRETANERYATHDRPPFATAPAAADWKQIGRSGCHRSARYDWWAVK